MKDVINLNELSTGNLKRIQKVLRIVLEELELQGINRLSFNKIPVKRLEKEDLSQEEAITILNGIRGMGEEVIDVRNEELKRFAEGNKRRGGAFIPEYDITPAEEDLNKYLFIWVSNLEKLKELMRRIDKILEGSEVIDKNQNKEAGAEYDKGILYFRDKEIDFNNKPNQKELLATIFKEPEKNWSYDEIQEKWDILKELNIQDYEYPKDYWKKFYSAGDDINKAVAIKTQLEDFIVKNTKEIRINPKYI